MVDAQSQDKAGAKLRQFALQFAAAFDARSILVSAVIAVATWLVTRFLFNFDTVQALMLSLQALVIREMIKVRIEVDAARKDLISDQELRALQRLLTTDSKKLADDLTEIVRQKHGPKDLFASHLLEELKRFQLRVSEAANTGQLVIDSDYIINVEGVFDSFNLCDEKILRLTYSLNVGDNIIGTDADVRFLEVALDFLKDKRYNELRILFILGPGSESHSNYVRLCTYLARRGAQLREVSKPDFTQLCLQNSVPPTDIEVGIYGPCMLYIARNTPQGATGVYIRNNDIVSRYRKLFDQSWQSESLTSVAPFEADAHASDTLHSLKTLEITPTS